LFRSRNHHELEFYLAQNTDASAEATTYFPQPPSFQIGPDAYVENISRAKAAVGIPIIGSLNGSSFGGWLKYAQAIEQAGADAIELNIYSVPTDADASSEEIEESYLTMLASLKGQLQIPIAVKLSP